MTQKTRRCKVCKAKKQTTKATKTYVCSDCMKYLLALEFIQTTYTGNNYTFFEQKLSLQKHATMLQIRVDELNEDYKKVYNFAVKLQNTRWHKLGKFLRLI